MTEQDNNEQDGRADFDFFMGSWNVRNRRLRERLKGSTSWEEFGGRTVARKILGGLGNVEEFTMERASGPGRGSKRSPSRRPTTRRRRPASRADASISI